MEGQTDPASQYLEKLGDELVNVSRNPHDRYHLGKLILKQLREHGDRINQIDGITDEVESNRSVLVRSTAAAQAFTSQGLEVGDIVLTMAIHSMDASVILYACLYVGVVPVNMIPVTDKAIVKQNLTLAEPKIVFCMPDRAELVKESASELGMNVTIITIGNAEIEGFENLKQFTAKFNSVEESDKFEARSFNTDTTVASMHCTSGSTGISKAVVHTHRSFIVNLPFWFDDAEDFPGPTRMAIMMTPLYWVSANIHMIIGALFVFPIVKLQPFCTGEQFIKAIQKYEPSWSFISIHMAMKWIEWLECPNALPCDMSCLDVIIMGGNFVRDDVIDKLKTMSGGTIKHLYGSTELAAMGFLLRGDNPTGSYGKPLPTMEYKLVNIGTGAEVGYNEHGELWIRGCLFDGYYKNEEANKASFTPDGWFRTGDIMYKDEQDYYYFVDRIGFLMKNSTGYISPSEIEAVIVQNPGVSDVAVCSYLERGEGDLPTAYVVRNKDSSVTAQDIKALVIDKLGHQKRLQGGVVFAERMPLTPTFKLDRVKLKELVRTMKRE